MYTGKIKLVLSPPATNFQDSEHKLNTKQNLEMYRVAHECLRMSQNQLLVILSRIESEIQKNNTSFRKAISAKDKLIFCLR